APMSLAASSRDGSPFRVLKTLNEIKEIGGVERIVAGRELTKAHEEIISGSVEEIVSSLSDRAAVKGEFAIIVVPGGKEDDADDKEDQYS
ncbi:MAG: hypothetical protein ACI4S4_04180, partial [Candidatus Ornithospirochaeta sp.]